MKIAQPRTLLLLSALLVGTAGITACSESPQQQYDKATSKLNDAKEALTEAKGKVDDQQETVTKAQQKLDELQNNISKQRNDVAEATQAVDKTVNDEVLFRTLQKELLNKDNFSDSAISVAVNNLVVTLNGAVPDQKTHDRAISLVKDQPGVADVLDQLRVGDAEQASDSSSEPAKQTSSQPASNDSDNAAHNAPSDNNSTPSSQPDAEHNQQQNQPNHKAPQPPMDNASSDQQNAA